MRKSCVICAHPFAASPSDKKVTCGKPVCVSENKSRTHTGTHPTWSAEARARKAREGQTPNLQLGTPAARHSPLAGPFETNQQAKLWWIVSPVGDRYHIRNLRKFCRDHPDLFAPDPWENACAGLRQVQAWRMGKTPRRVSQWKGWTLERAAVAPEEKERFQDSFSSGAIRPAPSAHGANGCGRARRAR